MILFRKLEAWAWLLFGFGALVFTFAAAASMSPHLHEQNSYYIRRRWNGYPSIAGAAFFIIGALAGLISVVTDEALAEQRVLRRLLIISTCTLFFGALLYQVIFLILSFSFSDSGILLERLTQYWLWFQHSAKNKQIAENLCGALLLQVGLFLSLQN